MEGIVATEIQEKVILAGRYESEHGGVGGINAATASISELESLAETVGCVTVAKVLQKKESIDNALYLGKGKIEEIKDLGEMLEADTVIFDDELTGAQIRNIENATELKVIDRTMLILDIFAGRAKSGEGKLQVELAQLKYRLPRLTGLGKKLSRLGGGIGTRGPGESKLETDRMHIRRRVHALEQRLSDLEKNRATLRKERERNNIVTAAIVGYTNAGKSTLLNALCDAGVLAEDKLFATLDTTTRKYVLPEGKEILFIDTVGFIRKLPHGIIEAFKSTLEEAVNADIIIHLADAADPELDAHLKVVDSLLKELKVKDTDPLLVFNKSDKLETPPVVDFEYHRRRPVYISAKTREGFDEFIGALTAKMLAGTEELTIFLPWSDTGAESWIRENSTVENIEYRDNGTVMKIKISAEAAGNVRKYVVDA